MAQRIQVVLEDDIDGSVASETVHFALDGVTYEIDLSEENAVALRDAFAPWIGGARRSGGRKIAARRSSAPARADVSGVRAWARENGYSVNERGRIPASVQEAYDRAH